MLGVDKDAHAGSRAPGRRPLSSGAASASLGKLS